MAGKVTMQFTELSGNILRRIDGPAFAPRSAKREGSPTSIKLPKGERPGRDEGAPPELGELLTAKSPARAGLGRHDRLRRRVVVVSFKRHPGGLQALQSLAKPATKNLPLHGL